MPTNKYLFIQAQAEATVYRIALTKRKIIIGITLCQTAPSRITSSHIQELYKPVTGLHIRLSVFQVTAVSMSSQKKNLPLESVIFKYLNSPLTTAVPSQWSRFWFRNCAEKDSKVTILHLKDNIYIKIRNKKGTQKRFLLSRTQIFWDWIALSKHRRLFCYTSPPLSQ